MLEQISNIKEKLSDKLLMGIISLDAILKNSSLDSMNLTDKPQEYNRGIGITGLVIGGLFLVGGRTLKEKGHYRLGNVFNYAGFGVIGGVTVAYFLI